MKLNKVQQWGVSNQIPHRPRRLLQHRQHAGHGVFAALIAHGHRDIEAADQVAMAVQQGHGDAAVVQLELLLPAVMRCKNGCTMRGRRADSR